MWGETHGVTIDETGLIYIKHRNYAKHPMDAIVVFDPQGKFVRSFGKEFHRGGHGIDVRKEGNEEFLYLCDVQHGIVAKTTLKGEHVWVKWTPEEPGVYSDKAKYSPTNVAFAADGGFYIGDGYGSSYIHQYDKHAKWVRTWGGFGDAPGKMKTPHGLWLDNRPGREPSLVVADRANARLQYFTLDGKHIGYVHEVSFPAHFDLRGEVMMVPDLHARVSLFDPVNKVIAHLGYDPAWTKQVLADDFKMRRTPQAMAGREIHPPARRLLRQGREYLRRRMGADRPRIALAESRLSSGLPRKRPCGPVYSARRSDGQFYIQRQGGVRGRADLSVVVGLFLCRRKHRKNRANCTKIVQAKCVGHLVK